MRKVANESPWINYAQTVCIPHAASYALGMQIMMTSVFTGPGNFFILKMT